MNSIEQEAITLISLMIVIFRELIRQGDNMRRGGFLALFSDV